MEKNLKEIKDELEVKEVNLEARLKVIQKRIDDLYDLKEKLIEEKKKVSQSLHDIRNIEKLYDEYNYEKNI